jgi:hypothetical protein
MTGPVPATRPLSVLERIDSLVQERVLVYGSLPPGGRDIDLVVRPADSAVIAAGLREDGFGARRGRWVKLEGCSVSIVELVPASTLNLPARELAAAFSEGVALERLRNIVEPAPHHTLLILARKVGGPGGLLAPNHRARIDRAVELDPQAWEEAWRRAPMWRAERSLGRLDSRYRGGRVGFMRRVRPRRPRRTRVVALSGVEESGRSSQAQALRATLDRLGSDTVVERPSPRPVALGFGAAFALWRPLFRHLGRGRVVIFDRYALDLAVSSPKRAKATKKVPPETRVLGVLYPTAARAYLLDPRATGSRGPSGESAVYRSLADFFGVRPLDAETPDDMCAQIAVDVVAMLDAPTTIRSLVSRLKRGRS